MGQNMKDMKNDLKEEIKNSEGKVSIDIQQLSAQMKQMDIKIEKNPGTSRKNKRRY